MKYLVCENCGGYYTLEEDEPLNDSELCHCGGKLYLMEEETLLELQYPNITCKYCGNENTINSAFCSECGQILTSAKDISRTSPREKLKPVGIFAGVTFILVSIVLLGLFI
ncbi:hypothetical protein [Methanobacterium sp. BAmetb5]|uniref:hypothetical protein n=1 Tax=Methanobacterium sp. BAmetb5 TaxID=2025351 RepID=UPI000E9DECAE|nr:hypothetical protein [Methanobacterium sp. BAmetb5]AXV39398.1 MAG: hypothetical protein CIT02_03270 [Methanobacterium sp. BAmetb5]